MWLLISLTSPCHHVAPRMWTSWRFTQKPVARPRAALVRLGRTRVPSSKKAVRPRLMQLGSKRAALGRLSKAVALQTGSERLWPLEALSPVRQAQTILQPVRDRAAARHQGLALMNQRLNK